MLLNVVAPQVVATANEQSRTGTQGERQLPVTKEISVRRKSGG